MDSPALPIKISFEHHTRVESLRRLSSFEDSFDRSFSMLAYISNRFLIDHMLRVGRLLTENDYETMVIWGVLAHQNVAHLMPPGTVPTAILTERGRLADISGIRPLRLRDVAAITGIPRETVRRKLERLAEKNYVRRTEAGWIVIGDRVEPDLREFTRDTVMRLVAVCDEVLAAMHKADEVSKAVGSKEVRDAGT